MKIVDYCESNNRWPGSVFRGSVPSPANFKKELPVPREVLINAGKMLVKERQEKNACG